MSGLLGKSALVANADTDVYTVPAATLATVNVNFCNRGSVAARVRLAVRSGALTNADYIEFDAEVPANGVLERTGLVLDGGEIVTVSASTSDVSVRVHGFEEVGS